MTSLEPPTVTKSSRMVISPETSGFSTTKTLSNSPKSSFSPYPNNSNSMKSPLRKIVSPIFQPSPSLQRVPLKIISNCTDSPEHAAVHSIPGKELPDLDLVSPKIIRTNQQSYIVSPKSLPYSKIKNMKTKQSSSPQALLYPPLISSSRNSQKDSFAKREGKIEIIDPPQLLPRMVTSNESWNDDTISVVSVESTSKQVGVTKMHSLFPRLDTKSKTGVEIGYETNDSFYGFSSKQANTREKGISNIACNHIQRNSNKRRDSRVTNTTKKHYSTIFSDDNICSRQMKDLKECHSPYIEVASIGQKISEKTQNPQSLGLHLSTEDLDVMAQDTSREGEKDIISFINDEDGDMNFFFLRSPKGYSCDSISNVKGTEKTSSRYNFNVISCDEASEMSRRGGSDSDHTSRLERNESDLSLDSIGLCLEGVSLCSELNSRDLKTPPVTRNDSITPPPINKISWQKLRL